MRCDHCRYWSPEDENVGNGECRRHAPQPGRSLDIFIGEAIAQMAAQIVDPKGELGKLPFEVEATEAYRHSPWPKTDLDDWCGDYQERE